MTERIELTRKEGWVPRALFGALAIMLIPFFLSNIVLKNDGYMLPLMLVAYVIQVLLLGSIVLKYYRGISKNTIYLFIWLLLFQMTTLIIDWIIGFSISVRDIAGALAKCVNFILLYGIMKNVKLGKQQITFFLKYFVLFSVLACCYNFVVNWSDILRFTTIQNTYELNLQSFFANRNQFGTFLFVAIVMHTYFVRENGIKLHNVVIYAIQFVSLLMTMSRGAILVTALFVGILVLKNIRKKRVLQITLIGLVFVCLVGVYILSKPAIVDYISRIFLRLGEGTTGRNSIWNMGIDTWKHNIFSGVGFYSGLAWARMQGFRYGQFHNMIVDILVSGGIAELIFLVFVFVTVIKSFKRKCKNKNYIEVYFSSFFAMLILGIVESVNFFSIGYADSIWTISFVTLPLLMSNVSYEDETEVKG